MPENRPANIYILGDILPQPWAARQANVTRCSQNEKIARGRNSLSQAQRLDRVRRPLTGRLQPIRSQIASGIGLIIRCHSFFDTRGFKCRDQRQNLSGTDGSAPSQARGNNPPSPLQTSSAQPFSKHEYYWTGNRPYGVILTIMEIRPPLDRAGGSPGVLNMICIPGVKVPPGP